MKGIGVLRWIAIAAMMASVPVPAWANTAVFVDATRPQGAAVTHLEMKDVLPSDYNVDVVPYPAQTWPLSGLNSHTAGYSTQIGADLLCQTLPDQVGRITVFGLSLGSMTIDRFLANLPTNVPAPERLSFVVMGDPFRGGVLAAIPAGTYIPILDLIKPDFADTPYDVVIIQNQYDAIGDFPDRPWNLVAVVNAVLGGLLYHNTPAYRDAAAQVQSGSVSPVSVEVNTFGATTTTYVVPRPVAITTVLKLLGVPEGLADSVDSVVKPMVEAGYSRNDVPPTVALPATAVVEAAPSAGPAEEPFSTPDPIRVSHAAEPGNQGLDIQESRAKSSGVGSRTPTRGLSHRDLSIQRLTPAPAAAEKSGKARLRSAA
jgi:hypothetical protein